MLGLLACLALLSTTCVAALYSGPSCYFLAEKGLEAFDVDNGGSSVARRLGRMNREVDRSVT